MSAATWGAEVSLRVGAGRSFISRSISQRFPAAGSEGPLVAYSAIAGVVSFGVGSFTSLITASVLDPLFQYTVTAVAVLVSLILAVAGASTILSHLGNQRRD